MFDPSWYNPATYPAGFDVTAYKASDETTWPVDPSWVDLESMPVNIDSGKKCKAPADFPFEDFFFASLNFEFDPIAFYSEQYCSINPAGEYCSVDFTSLDAPLIRRRLQSDPCDLMGGSYDAIACAS